MQLTMTTVDIRSARTHRNGSPPQIARALLRLREMIVTGELAAGTRVTELQLVGRVGVSRTPLRLAMEQLAHDGLLRRRPHGGFVVRQFTLREIQDAIELRAALEGTAARFAAERTGDPIHRDTLRAAVETMDALVQPALTMASFERYMDANARFHRALVDLAANSWLHGAIQQVATLPFASPNAFVLAQATSPDAYRVLAIAQEHHRTIAEAILSRESARADVLAREHARLALRFLDTALRDRDGFRQLPGGLLVKLS
jgi:GntR family transcriptional regulator of vanillate catabolism